jgi:CubicO group peptidase (beta-lactamase class C family)
MDPVISQHVDLSNFVNATAKDPAIPGVAVGVWADGQLVIACHDVTNVENPLRVDKDTLFVLGSAASDGSWSPG